MKRGIKCARFYGDVEKQNDSSNLDSSSEDDWRPHSDIVIPPSEPELTSEGSMEDDSFSIPLSRLAQTGTNATMNNLVTQKTAEPGSSSEKVDNQPPAKSDSSIKKEKFAQRSTKKHVSEPSKPCKTVEPSSSDDDNEPLQKLAKKTGVTSPMGKESKLVASTPKPKKARKVSGASKENAEGTGWNAISPVLLKCDAKKKNALTDVTNNAQASVRETTAEVYDADTEMEDVYRHNVWQEGQGFYESLDSNRNEKDVDNRNLHPQSFPKQKKVRICVEQNKSDTTRDSISCTPCPSADCNLSDTTGKDTSCTVSKADRKKLQLSSSQEQSNSQEILSPASSGRYSFRARGQEKTFQEESDEEDDLRLSVLKKKKINNKDNDYLCRLGDSDLDSDADSVIGGTVTVSNKVSSKRKRKNDKNNVEPDEINLMNEDEEWLEKDLPEITRQPVLLPDIAEELGEPIDYFEHFFDQSLLEYLTDCTNKYTTFMSKGLKSLNMDVDELKRFLGIWIYMGVVKSGCLRDYWAAETYVPQVAEVMTRDRYQSIRSALHCYDKSEEESLDLNDRFRKVTPLLNAIKKKCNDVAQERDLSLDEVMVPYTGKYAGTLRQYIPSKPHKHGFKLFALAGVSGFVYDFYPYQGEATFSPDDFNATESSMNKTSKTVLKLVHQIHNPAESTLCFDNWFASVALLQYLKTEYDLVATCTIRSNRVDHCPLLPTTDFKKKDRGYYDFRVKGDVIVTKWKDNDVVHVASTMVGVHPTGVAQRYFRDTKEYKEVSVPRCVQLYNQNMGGVDLSDMLVQVNRLPTRAKRWYFPLIGYIIDLSLCNAWILYKRHVDQMPPTSENKKIKPMASKDFRIAVSKVLRSSNVEGSLTSPRIKNLILNPRGARPDVASRYDCLGHWPHFTGSQGRCRYCSGGYTTVKCCKCNLMLCFTSKRNCFHKFHTE